MEGYLILREQFFLKKVLGLKKWREKRMSPTNIRRMVGGGFLINILTVSCDVSVPY